MLMYMQCLIQRQPAVVHAGGVVQVGQPKARSQQQQGMQQDDKQN